MSIALVSVATLSRTGRSCSMLLLGPQACTDSYVMCALAIEPGCGGYRGRAMPCNGMSGASDTAGARQPLCVLLSVAFQGVAGPSRCGLRSATADEILS